MTYPELDGYGEVVDTRLLSDSVTTGDAREVDIGRLDDAFLSFDSLDDFLGKPTASQLSSLALYPFLCKVPVARICHRQGRGASSILGFYNFVSAKLYT